MRSTHFPGSLSIWCSQMRITVQPLFRSRRKLERSLLRFPVILLCQYADNVLFHRGNRQPCQKSPSIKTATLAVANTRSGQPGNLRSWMRNRSPRECANFLTTSSGFVSLLRIRDIVKLRCSEVRLSTIALPAGSQGQKHSRRREHVHNHTAHSYGNLVARKSDRGTGVKP